MTIKKAINIKLLINIVAVIIYYIVSGFEDIFILFSPLILGGILLQFFIEFLINRKRDADIVKMLLCVVNFLCINYHFIVFPFWAFAQQRFDTAYLSTAFNPEMLLLLMPIWLPNIVFIVFLWACKGNKKQAESS